LSEIIRAHIAHQYNLIVPAACAQLEGMMVDFFGHTGKLHEYELKAFYRSAVQSDKTFSEPVLKFVDGVLLVRFRHGEEIKSTLSRHAVLHGADLHYGTASNSLKLILLLDYLQDRMKLLQYEFADSNNDS